MPNDEIEKDVNPYLALRQAKIARNQARLRELGLMASSSYRLGSKQQKKGVDLNASANATKQNGLKFPITGAAPSPLRRSSRKTRRPQTYDDGPAVMQQAKKKGKMEDEDETKEYQINEHDNIKSNDDEHPYEIFPGYDDSSSYAVEQQQYHNEINLSSLSPSSSAREIAIDVGRLVLGVGSNSRSDCDENHIAANTMYPNGLLGFKMEKSGKAYVMEQSAQFAAYNYIQDGPKCISFNKYSGVQEWSNDVLFLWVNLGNNNADGIDNDFLDEGKRITWFGGSRMHDNTRVIKRLIRVGKQVQQRLEHQAKNQDQQLQQVVQGGSSIKSASPPKPDEAQAQHRNEDSVKSSQQDEQLSQKLSSKSANGGIVLWCREYDTSKKTFQPYVCLGRLSYHSHQPGSKPLSFVWTLVDFELLKRQEDNEAIHRILRK